MSAPQPPPGLSQRLTLVLQTLQKIIASRAGRDRSVAPLVLLVWPYLHRVAKRFQALAQRLRDGGAADAPTRTRPAPISPRTRGPRLPRGFAWLIRIAPEAAPIGSQLRHLLTDPEFAALLAAEPRAARLLRPLCRMLGVRPDPDLPPALFKRAAPRPSAARSPGPDCSVPAPCAEPRATPLPLVAATSA